MSGLASLLFSSISTAAVPPPSPLSDHHRTVLPCVFGVSSPREGARCSKLSGCRQTNSAPISLTDNHHTDCLSAGKSWATSVWFGLTGEDETTLRGTQTRNQKHAEMKKNRIYKGIIFSVLWLNDLSILLTLIIMKVPPFADDGLLFLAKCCLFSAIIGVLQWVAHLSMSLPLFRVHLTTHMQVCTVIRFSQSRFVPPSELFLHPSSPAAELFSSLQMEKQTWLPSNFLFWLSTFRGCWCPICVFPQPLFASSWTRVYTLFDIYGFLICLLFVMFYSPSHSFPLYLLTLFPSLLSFLVLCLPHLFRLRWSSPDTTMVFSLEISPTAFRDAIWR